MFTTVEYHSILTLLFFIAFIAMGIWVYWPKRKAHYNHAANIPFLEDEQRNDQSRLEKEDE